MNDYDDVEETAVDDDEAKAAEKGASDSSESSATDGDMAEADLKAILEAEAFNSQQGFYPE